MRSLTLLLAVVLAGCEADPKPAAEVTTWFAYSLIGQGAKPQDLQTPATAADPEAPATTQQLDQVRELMAAAKLDRDWANEYLGKLGRANFGAMTRGQADHLVADLQRYTSELQAWEKKTAPAGGGCANGQCDLRRRR